MTLPALTEMALTIGHKPEADPYPKWNGVWAVKEWHRLGATAFDCDTNLSADGTAWAIHWSNWWEHRIVVKPGLAPVPHKQIGGLTDEEIRRLVHADGWELNTVREVMEAAAPLGITVCLEAKYQARLEQREFWRAIKADALETGCAIVAMTIQNYPDQRHARARLAAAHAEGVPTLLLTRGPISAGWWEVLDGAKGSASQVGTLPPGKVRLGTSSANATKYGCSCGPSTAKAATTKVLKLGGVQVPESQVPMAPRIEKAKAAGLVNVEDAAIASMRSGLPFEAACALLTKESGGRNIYGHDKGGYFTVEGDKAVTEENFAEFRHAVVDLGHTSNGVGPCQITYRGYFPIMSSRGLRAWLPVDNMQFGFELLRDAYKANGNDWAKAGTVYNAGSLRNGVNDYGRDLAALVTHYRDLFNETANNNEEEVPMTSVQKITSLARKQVGYHEGRSGGHWNNHEKYAPEVPGLEWAQNQAWCATFVSWLALKSGNAKLYPRTASCDVAGAWFKSRGRWSEYPAIGAQVFYGHPSDLNHTGLVVDYDGTYVWAVEGNTNTNGSREGDGVYLKKRRRRDSGLIGYGYPKFPEGIKSADPRYKDQAPKPGPKPKPKPKHRAEVSKLSAAVSAVARKFKCGNVGVAVEALRNASKTARPVNQPAINKALDALKEIQ